MPLGEIPYCDNCQKAVVDFMNKFGAGTLTRDPEREALQKSVKFLTEETAGLKAKLEAKNRRVEELKAQLGEMKNET